MAVEVFSELYALSTYAMRQGDQNALICTP